MRHLPVILLLTALAAAAVVAGWQSAPWLFTAGLALAAGAPLFFIAHHALVGGSRPLLYHPLGISIAAGLGCVMTLAGQYRFGRFNWVVGCALLALVAWMLWQRYMRSSQPGKASRIDNRSQQDS
jgi:hypothetical protein